jgi:protein gp37
MKVAANRLDSNSNTPHYAGTTKKVNGNAVWTGKVALAPYHILNAPLHWKKPRKIFVNSMGDLFHEDVPDEWIDRVFAIMALCPQHTFQVLTKRAKRMREYVRPGKATAVGMEALEMVLDDHAIEHAKGRKSNMGSGVILTGDIAHLEAWPLPNVWLGVSAEDQARADERIPDLLATPAAVRFVSAEPLLGPIDFNQEGALWNYGERTRWPVKGWPDHPRQAGGLDWIIAGSESGPNARPCNLDWVRSIRDQCQAAGVAFFWKQHVENNLKISTPVLDGRTWTEFPQTIA